MASLLSRFFPEQFCCLLPDLAAGDDSPWGSAGKLNARYQLEGTQIHGSGFFPQEKAINVLGME